METTSTTKAKGVPLLKKKIIKIYTSPLFFWQKAEMEALKSRVKKHEGDIEKLKSEIEKLKGEIDKLKGDILFVKSSYDMKKFAY